MNTNVNALNKIMGAKLSQEEAELVNLLCSATGRDALGIMKASKWSSGLHTVAGGGACVGIDPAKMNGGAWNKLGGLADAAGYVVSVEPAGRDLEVIIKPKSGKL